MIHTILLAVSQDEKMSLEEELVNVGTRQAFLTSMLMATTLPLESGF